MDIKEIRNKLNMTQSEFAHELGVESITVSRWERGQHQPKGKLIRNALARMQAKAEKAE
jgi:DNA-binding transcriptional regulator YiaG